MNHWFIADRHWLFGNRPSYGTQLRARTSYRNNTFLQFWGLGKNGGIFIQ